MTVKEYLSQAYHIDRLIDSKIEVMDKLKTLAEKAAERERELESTTVTLYSTTGRKRGYIDAYKGEYDGHKFYIFLGTDKMTVIPEAMVEYYENLLKPE